MLDILITNDDGFEAAGINELAKALKSIARVTVVAPSSEKSACAHSITTNRPLRFIRLDDNFFKLDDATPSDCIYLGLHAFYKDKKPNLIISGINHGANLGEDITYSGTCGGAMEGVLQDIPSIAVSQVYIGDSLEKFGFDLACEVTIDLVKRVVKKDFPLPKRKFLNLNIPPVCKKDFKGIKVVPVGQKFYSTDAQINRNPKGMEYYWIGKGTMNYDPSINQNTDLEAVFSGYASLSPLMLNLTAKDELENVEKWLR